MNPATANLLILMCATPAMVCAGSQASESLLRLTFPGAGASTPQYESSGRVRLPGLYPGIDAVFYRNHVAAEYDFVVAPYADPAQIRIAFEGADRIRLTEAGDIEVRKGRLVLEHRRPFAYQRFARARRPVACRYRLGSGHQVLLEIGAYDRRSVLVIDPVLQGQFSLAFGGGSYYTTIAGVTTDSGGYTYVAGSTSWPSFPVTPGPLSYFHGGSGLSTPSDVFVVKLAPTTNTVVWSVLIGGSGTDVAAGIAVDAQGNVYVGGHTESPDFPATSAPANAHAPAAGDPDLFVFKLNPKGTALVYATLIGGSGYDQAFGLALAPDGHVAIVGSTTSIDFPVTPNAVQSSLTIVAPNASDAVIVRLNPAGAVDYASYLGGPGEDYATDVAFDPAGDIYIAGIAGPYFPTLASSFAPEAVYGGFVTRLDHTTGQFVYSTYIPGVSTYGLIVSPHLSIRVDASQHAYVSGPAEFVFPTTPGAFQADVQNTLRTAFVLELNPAGTGLVFSTLIGGGSDDVALGLVLTGDSVTIAGITNSFDFPVTDHSMTYCNMASGTFEISPLYSTFVASFDHTGKLLTSVEYNSGCNELLVTALAAGSQTVLMAFQDWSATHVVFIDLAASMPVQIFAVTDSASYEIGPYCPLELISIFGRGLGPQQGVSAAAAGGYMPTELAGSRVWFGGLPVPLLYVSDSQINGVVPGHIGTMMATMTVLTAEGTSQDFQTWLAESAPAVFTVDQSGVGQGAILNQDLTLNSPSNPAARGSVIAIYGTGGGETSPEFGDGQIVPGASPLAFGNPWVVIDGVTATVLYAGTAPGLINGGMQVNVSIPTTVNPGPSVPLYLWGGGYHSQSGVTVAIK